MRIPDVRIPALVLILLFGTAAVAQAAVRAELLPADVQVEPETIFDLQLTVPEAGSAFNAYETRIEYDPAKLTFIRLSPISLQEGDLMKNACTNRWHLFNDATPGVLTISHALLCAGVKVTGPGVLYKLRFQAAAMASTTDVRIVSIVFADAGINVTPVYPADAHITIGTPAGIGDGLDGDARAALLAAWPNPFRQAVSFHVRGLGDARARLDILDVRGRRVATLLDETLGEGAERIVTWNGRTDAGPAAPPGVYWARLENGSARTARRIVRLP